jgi:hypothetical protein
MLKAYGQCHSNLVGHDRRYAGQEYLWRRTVAGYEDTQDGVKLVISAVDSADARPLWFCNWGTDNGSATSCLKRALDEVLRERGQGGYERFKNRLRLSSADRFGEHTVRMVPPFRIWVDTLRPEVDRKRWYHQFSALTATAGGFDVERDVRKGHGPLGALYPTGTTHRQKEGDTMSFLYLVPTGMNEVEEPSWGSWAGRYGRNETFPGRPYYWANQKDAWEGSTSRENTLGRWAIHLQNDFKARLDWCVKDYGEANHPPRAQVRGALVRRVKPGERVTLDASESADPDQDGLEFQWVYYAEVGSYEGARLEIEDADSAKASFVAPEVDSVQTIHIILMVTDKGTPPLTRYQRLIVTVEPANRR